MASWMIVTLGLAVALVVAFVVLALLDPAGLRSMRRRSSAETRR